MNTFTYASFGRRFIAWVIDMLLIGIVQGILLEIYGFDWTSWSDGFIQQESREMYKGFGFSGLLSILYFTLFESSELQATVGKRLMGIQVTDYNGERITPIRALVRTLSKYLSRLIVMIGYLMAAFTEKNQALHDFIAATYVIEKDDQEESLASGETV
jgi:uncharacterized RDD family membrane protein YckC